LDGRAGLRKIDGGEDLESADDDCLIRRRKRCHGLGE
jgi:hypothetical protein